MRVKTFLKISDDDHLKPIKRMHSGTAGITVALDTSKKPAEIFIEYFGTDEMILTMMGDLLVMFHERVPGSAQNAIKNYLEATNQVSKDGKFARINFKKGDDDSE